METWKVIAMLLGPLALVLSVCGLVADILRHRKEGRLDRETYEKRPLLPEGAAELVRPGDTVMIVIPDHYEGDEVYIKYLNARAKEFYERGIKFVVFQEFMLKKNLILVAGENSEGGEVAARLADRLDRSIGGNSGAES